MCTCGSCNLVCLFPLTTHIKASYHPLVSYIELRVEKPITIEMGLQVVQAVYIHAPIVHTQCHANSLGTCAL